MTVSVIDTNNTDGVLVIDTNAPDARSLMLTSAAALVATTLEMEGKLSDTAKAWGANVFTLAYPADDTKPVTLDALIGDSKMAAQWSQLTNTDAGKKAKARMEVYFSNARLVAETFESLSDDDKRDIRAGVSSIHYRAGLIRKAASDAKKLATKEAARVAAEQAAADSKVEALVPATSEPVARTLADVLAEAMAMIGTASDADLDASYDAVSALVAAFDARINAATGEPVAIAA